MARHRVAVALLVPQPLATELDGIRRALGAAERERVVPHLTLVSPVNLGDAVLQAGLDLVRKAAGACAGPLALTIGPATTFHPVTPTVHLGVGGPGLADLLDLRRAMTAEPPLDRPEPHEFVPHVTLAQELAPPERIAPAIDALREWRHDVSFERVHVLRQGPDHVWAPFADAALGPPAVVGRGGIEVGLTTSARPGPDAAALLAVDGAGGGRPFCVTARLGDEVAGAAWGWTSGSIAEIADLAVAAAHRNLGIGRRLLDAVEAEAAARGVEVLLLAAPGEGPAAALLRGAGWQSAGDQVADGRRLWRRAIPEVRAPTGP
jgi:2'-5' RNA ligase/GNAT superfamily N-acetyltransferase